MLWSAQEMSKKFRMSLGKNVSPIAIHVFAEKLGYHMKRIGGKKGYDQSLYTALTRHLRELLDYDSQQTVKTSQRPQKQPNLGDYYTYNGERDNVDYEWEKNEGKKVRKMKRINITENQLNVITEIDHLAEKSNVTICSLEDFKSLVSSMGINDVNVEEYVGQYCFIEIGSSYPRIYTEMQFSNVNVVNGQEYTPKDFYKVGQWYFTNEHTNVIKLEFDDNQEMNNKNPNLGKDPSWKPSHGETSKEFTAAHKKRIGDEKGNPMNVTAVALRKNEMKPEIWDELNKKSLEKKGEPYKGKKVFYYGHGKNVNDELINRLKEFVDSNLAMNPNIKFVLHCRAGQSRSAAVGVYLAKKIGQYTEDFLSEYGDQIKMPRMKDNGKRSKSYPHQNMLNGLSRAEGWQDLSGKRQATKAAERWWYPEMMNYLEKNGK